STTHPTCFFVMRRHTTRSSLFPYTTLFRSGPPWFSANACRLWRTSSTHSSRDRGPAWCGRRGFIGWRNVPVKWVIFPSPEGWCRSEEHTSELQSRENLVCRLQDEKKKNAEK